MLPDYDGAYELTNITISNSDTTIYCKLYEEDEVNLTDISDLLFTFRYAPYGTENWISVTGTRYQDGVIFDLKDSYTSLVEGKYIMEICAEPGNYTKILLHMNGGDNSINFIDETGKIWYPRAVLPYIKENVLRFDGGTWTTAEISTPHSDDFNLEAYDWEIEFDYTQENFNSGITVERRIDIDNRFDLFMSRDHASFNYTASGSEYFDCYLSGIESYLSFLEWANIKIGRSGTNIYFELNGNPVTLIGDHTVSGSLPNLVSPLRISDGFGAQIDNFKFTVNGVVVSELNFNGENYSIDIIDESGKIWTGLSDDIANPIMAHIDTSIKKFGTGSGIFSVIEGGIQTDSSEDFNVADGDWTWDWWIWFSAGNHWNEILVIEHWDSYQSAEGYQWGINMSPDTIIFDTHGVEFYCEMNSPLSTDGWHHIAVTRYGNIPLIFIDGISQTIFGDTDLAELIIPDVTDTGGGGKIPLQIGSVIEWDGDIILLDEVRFSTVARWIENFTPPTQEYTL